MASPWKERDGFGAVTLNQPLEGVGRIWRGAKQARFVILGHDAHGEAANVVNLLTRLSVEAHPVVQFGVMVVSHTVTGQSALAILASPGK